MARAAQSQTAQTGWQLVQSLVKCVGAFEAKTHLSRLLEEVEAGEQVLITLYG